MLLLFFYFVIGTTGCATIEPEQPSNTVILKYHGYQPYYSYKDYEIEIISEPLGARIEINNEYIGQTPMSHTSSWVSGVEPVTIIAYPIYPGQYTQTKVILNRPAPHRIFFDMRLKPTGNDINVNINQ